MTVEKQNWLTRDGGMLDGGFNPDSRTFAWFENNVQGSHQNEIDSYIDKLLIDESWFSGNRGAALIALQIYFWFRDKITAAQKQKLQSALTPLPRDDYFWATRWNNGTINCVTVRYIMAQADRTANCQYGWVGNPSTPEAFIWQGRNYAIGKRYNTFQLCSDWLFKWIDRYFNAEYLEGELFSETYSYHYLNCLITLADGRMTADPVLRERAATAASMFLFEHGVNTNKKHLAAPLGRTYMNQHTTGAYMFFPFLPYFGFMPEVHYGTANSWYISEYQLPTAIHNFANVDGVSEIFSNVQGGRYVYSHPKFTLGSNPHGGNWMLQIVSDDSGPYPKARFGQPFRIWINNNPRDLDPTSCSGECYSEMGQGAFQYRDAMLIAVPGPILHQALVNTRWNTFEKVSGWQFGLENGVAVAMRLDADSAGLEVSVIGTDDSSYDSFKTAVLAKSKLSGNSYLTRKGDRIEISTGQKTKVNGVEQQLNLPRLEVKRGSQVTSFNSLFSGDDLTPPSAPTGLRIE